MPGLVLPRYRHDAQFKPVGVPRIDWAHPLAQGLLLYGLDTGGPIVDLVGNRRINSITAGAGPKAYQQGLCGSSVSTDNGNGGQYFAADSIIRTATANPPWTCATGYINTVSAAATRIVFGRSANNDGSNPFVNWSLLLHHQGTAANGEFYLNSGGNFTLIGGEWTGNTLNTFHTMVGVATSSSAASFYADGALIGSTSSLAIQSVNSGDDVCFQSDKSSGQGLGMAGSVPFGAFYGRALSAGEAEWLHHDPYCFLIWPETELPALSFGPPRLASGTGSFAFTFPPQPLSIDFNKASVGSSISGGTFSRGRWRKLIEEEEERAAEERRAKERAEAEAREAQRKARKAKAQAKREARRQRDEAEAARRAEAASTAAVQASVGTQQLAAALQQAHLMVQAARAAHNEAQARAVEERADEAAIMALLEADEEARRKATNSPLAKSVAALIKALTPKE